MKTSLFFYLFIFTLLLATACKPKYPKNELETVKIKISKLDFEKIEAKRKEALDIGVLLTSKQDYVASKFQIDSSFVKSKIRLKGDWVDHLEHPEKWSFRVKISKGKTYHGMKKFSLQHPATRNYIYEWVFHKMQKEMGLVSLRYEFVNLILDIDGKEKNLGIYVLEEAFDKRLIENNERRSGLILKFDESQLWEERAYAKVNGTAEKDFETMYQNAPITSFNKNAVSKDNTLRMQFKTASDLLDGYRKKTLASQQVFDLEKTAKFLAIVDLLGGEHAVIWHNLRFYYNPISSKLEPIGFDAIGGVKYNYVIQSHTMGKDTSLAGFHIKELETVSSDSFLVYFKNKYADEMNGILKTLNTEFDDIVFDEDILIHNQAVIRDYLKKNPPNTEAEKKKLKNLTSINFLKLDQDNNVISFKKGSWRLQNTLIIPKGYIVIAQSGFNLDILDGAEIISESQFIFKGTKDEPIIIKSSEGNGDGLLLKNCTRESRFEYVEFVKLSNPKNEKWSITGAVTVYQSDVSFKNVSFKDNRSEDALNVFSANFSMENCIFQNTMSDAFDGDFVTGTIKNCKFIKLGNDAIDVSGSDISIENIDISEASDKCISAGEKSKINGKNVNLFNSELAISSKDMSEINFTNLNIDSCKVAFTAFQKKSEFDKAFIKVANTKVTHTDILHLIETRSILSLNDSIMPNTINVKDRLYGNEFGKSSK